MAGAILGKFSGKSCDSNVFNNNDMHLCRELFENVIASDEYKDAIERGHYIGYLGHPEDPACQEFQNACIVMTDMKIEENGDINADFNLVDTPVGRIVKAFIDAGVKFGISIRGAGDVSGDGEVDPETFIFRGFDLVAFPAYNDCVPTFQEVAASSDINKQKKYKKVCAAVTKNLSEITSCEALETIRSQFVEGTSPYDAVSARLDELSVDTPAVTIEVPESLQDQQVSALVNLYSDAIEEIDHLKEENSRLLNTVEETTTSLVHATSKIKRMSRIHETQIDSLDSALAASDAKVNEEHDRYLSAHKQIRHLTARVNDVEKMNLNYSQKIQSSNSALLQKDKEIERLRSTLRETVTASKELRTNASNYDAQVNELKTRVAAAEEMIFAYQQAYANLFANALGKKVSNLSVTASTSPEDLRKSILGSTSTEHIPAKPEYECEYFDEDEDDGLVSL